MSCKVYLSRETLTESAAKRNNDKDKVGMVKHQVNESPEITSQSDNFCQNKSKYQRISLLKWKDCGRYA